MFSRRGSAAAARAAAAATAAERRPLLGADGGEDRELLAHVRGAAVRTIGLPAERDQLLVVRLALHADELVDRHAASLDNAAVWNAVEKRLEGRVVVLEPLEPRHALGLRQAAAFPEIWQWAPIDAGTNFDEWLAYALAQQTRREEVPLVTLRADTGDVIGSTRFLALRPEHRSLEI